ncbi:MAG TPA: isoprenylcysteine carboxylmethyltransferase family protein, partial [Gammaproteobacteria bacterium]
MELRIPPVVVVLACALSMWLLDRFAPLLHIDFPGAGFIAVMVAIAGIAVCVRGVTSFQRAGTTMNPLDPGRASALV